MDETSDRPANGGAGRPDAGSSTTLNHNNISASGGGFAVGVFQGNVYHNSPGFQPTLDKKAIAFNWPMDNRDLFVGRESSLASIGQMFQEDAKALALIASHGMGGVGKTQIAIRYFHESRCLHKLWFDAENLETLVSQYSGLGIGLGLFVREQLKSLSSAQIVTSIKQYVENFAVPFLIVYDNANDYKELEPYLPKKGGHVLVTSRQTSWPKKIPIEVMKEAEACALIMKILEAESVSAAAPTYDMEDVKALAHRLGYLPLALAQAASYIKENEISIVDYSNDFVARLSDPSMPVGFSHHPVVITWQISIDKIKAMCPDAIKLLQISSFLDTTDIPIFLLNSLMRAILGDASTEDNFNQTKKSLIKYSFLKHDAVKSTLSTHSLMQAITRRQMSEEERQGLLNSMLTGFCELIDKIRRHEEKVILKLQQIVSHLDQLLAHYLPGAYDKTILVNTLKLSAQVHINIGSARSIEKAICYLNQALMLYESLPGDHSYDLACIHSDLASANVITESADAYANAKKHYNTALEIWNSLGQERNVAVTLDGLGWVYYKLGGKPNKTYALSCYNKAWDIKFKYAKGNLLQLAEIYGEMAFIISAMDDDGDSINKVIGYYQQALEMMEKSPDCNPSRRAMILDNLGSTYSRIKNFPKAIECHTLALQAYGNQRSSVSVTFGHLAHIYYELGGKTNLLKAIEYEEKALSNTRSHVGNEHIAVANILENLGFDYCKLNDETHTNIAIDYFQQALAIKSKVLNVSHPDIRSAELKLADAKCQLKKLQTSHCLVM